MNRSFIYIVFFLICVLSRLLTSIDYLEDYQSVLISLNVKNSDFISAFNNSHAPLFILLVKFFSLLTNNFYLAFSIIGGISVYFIIHFTLHLLSTPMASLEVGLISFLIFFNPLIWIASNRFTPELAGCTLAMGGLFFLIGNHENKYSHTLGGLFVGLSGGLYFPYILFLIIPLFYCIVKKKMPVLTILFLMAGLSTWIIPNLLSGSNETLYHSLVNFTYNIPNDHFIEKFLAVIRDTWAAGLGGILKGRLWTTILTTLAVLPLLFFGMIILMSFEYNKAKMISILLGVISFIGFILVFNNYNNSSVSIFIPFLMIILSYGIIYFLVNFNTITVKGLILAFLLSQPVMGIYFAMDHKNPTAAEQLRHYVFNRKTNSELFVNSEKLQFYLLHQGIPSKYGLTLPKKNPDAKTYFVSDRELPIPSYATTEHFQHNFVTNPHWSAIILLEY